MAKTLLVLGCSQAKRSCAGLLPAIDRYDGPAYRVVRSFLRQNKWPQGLSVGVLSAKYGLFGCLKGIENYDLRMDRKLAASRSEQYSSILKKWAASHDTVHLALGKDYLPAVGPALESLGPKAKVFRGPIGMKLQGIKQLLESTSSTRRPTPSVRAGSGRVTYFLPDWDDLLDPNFDFLNDSFSGANRRERGDKHCSILIKPQKLCDGILVSLAQYGGSKGPLACLDGPNEPALSPMPLRERFGLMEDQWLFGDCGAFSYINQDEPTISVDQAVSLYDLHGFDFGASVDHIPANSIRVPDGTRMLSRAEKTRRVNITRQNAELFINAVVKRHANFNPVGVIQALSPSGYAKMTRYYYELGYRHMAIGGLVPLGDGQVAEVARAVSREADLLPERPWLHLFGVFRPKLQKLFRDLRIDSFDSATYFRKAWLRSDQNYLSIDGSWYAALRVPMLSDARTRKRLESGGADIDILREQEHYVLELLNEYDTKAVSLENLLDAILDYDLQLIRSSDFRSLREAYRRTLLERPWEKCSCKFCRSLGIHIMIFRGANRNKRRGAHNTLMLYQGL